MTVQPIRLFGDPVLRSPADPVVDFDKELRQLIEDLTETMHEQSGAGLAAPQIGVGLRVFAFEVEDVVGHLVNPVLEFPDEEDQEGPEGCLSIPGLYFDTKRRRRSQTIAIRSCPDSCSARARHSLLARAAAALPETLGRAAVLLHDYDPARIAELMHVILQEEPLRERLRAAAGRNLSRFRADAVERAWGLALADLRR